MQSGPGNPLPQVLCGRVVGEAIGAATFCPRRTNRLLRQQPVDAQDPALQKQHPSPLSARSGHVHGQLPLSTPPPMGPLCAPYLFALHWSCGAPCGCGWCKGVHVYRYMPYHHSVLAFQPPPSPRRCLLSPWVERHSHIRAHVGSSKVYVIYYKQCIVGGLGI